MMDSMRWYRFLCVSAVLLALPGCWTEEITSGPVTIADVGPGPNRGGFLVVFAPPDLTPEEQQARLAREPPSKPPYILRLDGKRVSYDADGVPSAFLVYEGGASGFGYLPAGPHRFEIASAGDGRTVFTADGEIRAGWEIRLYLFGARGALDGRFIAYPEQPAQGILHVRVINLVRDGTGIEVVGCKEGTPCTPLSPALALGQSFEADLPAGSVVDRRFQLADGAAVGFRQVSTATLSDPPVQLLAPPISLLGTPSGGAIVGAAPVFLSPQGEVLTNYN
jgi:hypothetical protein